MSQIEITGIRKDNGNHENPHEAVTHYRWINRTTGNSDVTERQAVVRWLDFGVSGEKITAYVQRVNPRAECFVNQSAHGTRFLQTHADATEQNNLLKLPEV